MAEPPLLAPLARATVLPRLDDSPALDPGQAPSAGFTNPVCAEGADPWVMRWAGSYWYCRSQAGSIVVSRSERLHEIGRAEASCVFRPVAGRPWSRHLWAPELHRLDGRFYIYFAADDGRNLSHRMYVLEGDAEDARRPFVLKGRIADRHDRWAIDGTVLAMDDGRRYFLWSGWEGDVDGEQSLYIAPLANPWTLAGERVRLSRPEHHWECRGRPLVNEGPTVLRNRQGRLFLVYSASGSWTDDYCLGLLTLTGQDPMEPGSWVKSPSPVFARSGLVCGPGHASFVRSPDDSEDWVVYHAARRRGSRWDRDVRMQRLSWTSDGMPDFGVPVPPGVRQALPSGTGPWRAGRSAPLLEPLALLE